MQTHFHRTNESIRPLAFCFCLMGTALFTLPHAALADVRPVLTTIALSGMPAPGVSGATFSDLTYSGPTIGPTGIVAFPAILLGHGNVTGIFAGPSANTLSLVALQSNPAPGTTGTFLTGSTSPPVNSTDEIAAYGQLWPGGTINSNNDEGIWVGHPTADTLVAREGSPAPLPGGLLFGSPTAAFSSYVPVLNNTGQVAFQTGLQNSVGAVISGFADWVTLGPQVLPVAQTGGPAAGLPPGATLTALGSPGLNDGGSVIYSGSFQSPLGPVSSGTGIWSANPAFTAPIVLTGQVAPGIGPAAATFQTVGFRQTTFGTSAHVSSAGETVFFGTVTGPGIVPNMNDHGVWFGGNGYIGLIARQGDEAPGLPLGTTFASFTDSGIGIGLSTGVLATVDGPGITAANNTGIWLSNPATLSLHLAVRNGDSVPDGVNAPVIVAGLSHFTMNRPGEFVTQLSDTTILGDNPLGQLIVVARPGDSIQVAPGDLRTIQSIVGMQGGEAGSGATSFNDLGLVTFTALFTDGSTGTFVSNALRVPEPASYILAVMGVLAFVPRHWLRRRKSA